MDKEDECICLADLARPEDDGFNAVFEALEKEVFPESHRKNVREEGDDTKMLGMCLGVTSHYTKGAQVSAATRHRPGLARLLCSFARKEIPDFHFTSIQVNKDYQAAMHVDKNNLGPSWIVGLGNYTGGWLWMDTHGEMGHATDVRRKWLKFDGRKPHCVTPFRGRRYTLVFFTYSNPQKSTSLSRQEEKYLRALAFPLPAQVCSNRASAASVSRPLPCPTMSVQAARYSFLRFKQKVAARGGLRRKALIVQAGKSIIRVMVSSEMPLKLASEAVPHGKAYARLFTGSLRLLGTDRLDRLGLRSCRTAQVG